MKRRNPYRGPFRVNPDVPLNFDGELIVDLFAGGGGASMGIEWALGRSPDIAVNHDPQAVRMHQVNHPHTKHYCESVFNVSPQDVCGGRPVGYLWMSPDCTHYSKARGKKPVSKRVRGLAWVGKRWAATVRPRVIFLENVEEFKSWGPLVRVNGEWHPCKKRSGRTFRNFVRELNRLGYVVDWQEMRACDYGAPTIRKRLFLVARCDGEPIRWPEPTHGDPKAEAVKGGALYPWRTAAECIDWSISCPSIFERKRPLAENTLRRIARGIKRYVIDNPEPFIVPIQHYNGRNPAHSIKQPLRTVTAYPKGGSFALVAPSLLSVAHSKTTGRGPNVWDVREPLRTIASVNDKCIVAPSISTYYGPKKSNHHRGQELTEPLRTQTTENRHALQAAMLLKHYGGVVGTSLDVPAGTVTTQDHHAIAAAHLVRHFGESVGSSPAEPVGTVMPHGKGKTGIIATNLVRHFGKSAGADCSTPMKAVTSKSKDSLVASNLVKLKGTCRDGQRTDAPLHTVTSGGTHFAEVRAFLIKYFGVDVPPDIGKPFGTLTTKDRFGLCTVRGELYQIIDIGMRMLVPRELYRAQGFPDSYIIERDCDGKPITITDQVRMCGNSVSPYAAMALVMANAANRKAVAA